jgi:2-amino-4-hydroxy-6-hydroxymethyldihydropteridine diphosphokinase
LTDRYDPAIRAPVLACVGLGANLGDARATLTWALRRLGQAPIGCERNRSSVYRSAPIDAGGPDYLNAVVAIETPLTAPELLTELLTLEAEAGRERPYRNAPRTLDLDLLLYGTASIESPTLTVPHPRMNARAFVLLPLAEIAPDRVSVQAIQDVATQRIERLDPVTGDLT